MIKYLFACLLIVVQCQVFEICTAQIRVVKPDSDSKESIQNTENPSKTVPSAKTSEAGKATVLILSNMDCMVLVDGIRSVKCVANKGNSIQLSLGKHELVCTTLDNKDVLKHRVEINSTKQEIVDIDLLSVKNNRIELSEKILKYMYALKFGRNVDDLVEKIKEFIDLGADVSYKKNCLTAIFWAAFYNQPAIVKLLLEHGANANEFSDDDYYGDTPLHFLTRNTPCVTSESTVIKLLIEFGADFEARNKDGNTPLVEAINHRCKEIPIQLIKLGANVNTKNSIGLTPLHLAVNPWNNNLELVQLLLDNKADVNARDNEGRTSLSIAEDEDIRSLLRKYGAK